MTVGDLKIATRSTRDSAERLGLMDGDNINAIIKPRCRER
jgi:hypothetical protein